MLNYFGLSVWELRIENLNPLGEIDVFYLNVHLCQGTFTYAKVY